MFSKTCLACDRASGPAISISGVTPTSPAIQTMFPVFTAWEKCALNTSSGAMICLSKRVPRQHAAELPPIPKLGRTRAEY